MLAICVADTLVVFKAPKTSSKSKSVSQGTNPRAKPGHKKLSTSSNILCVQQMRQTTARSYKAPTILKFAFLRKKSSSPSLSHGTPLSLSQPLVSTLVDTGMHKEDQQATGGPTSLRVTSEARANPQLNSRNDALAVSTAKADPEKSAPSDFVPQQQGKGPAPLLDKLRKRKPPAQSMMKMRRMRFTLLLKTHQFQNPHLPDLSKLQELTQPKSSFFSLKSINWNLRRTKLKLKLLSLKLNPVFLMWDSSMSFWTSKANKRLKSSVQYEDHLAGIVLNELVLALHKREHGSRVNERQRRTTMEKLDTSKELDASSVIIKSNGTESQEQDTSSSSGNDAHVDDADIRPIYDEETKG
ncbi:hypothetical protein Tco_1560976 [Tanacetum coccineum]